MIVPSVTVWDIPINFGQPDMYELQNSNPAVRKYDIDASYTVTNYLQYHLDLVQSNTDGSAKWELLYDFKVVMSIILICMAFFPIDLILLYVTVYKPITECEGHNILSRGVHIWKLSADSKNLIT